MKQTLKKMLCLLLALCLTAAAPLALGEEDKTTVAAYLCTEGRIAFTLCGVPTLYRYEDDEELTDIRLLEYTEGGHGWACILCDAVGLIEEIRPMYPGAAEDDLRCLAALYIITYWLPTEAKVGNDDYEFYYLQEETDEDTLPAAYLRYRAEDGSECFALGAVDGTRAVIMMGPGDDMYHLLNANSIHFATEEDRETARLRLTPTPVTAGSVTVTMPAVPLSSGVDAAKRWQCLAEGYLPLSFLYTPMDLSEVVNITPSDAEKTDIQQITDSLSKLGLPVDMKDMELWSPKEGCLAFGFRYEPEDGGPAQRSLILYLKDGMYILSGGDDETTRAMLESLTIAEEPVGFTPVLPEANEDNSPVYSNSYLGYSLRVPEWFTPMSDEENAAILEQASANDPDEPLYDLRTWYYRPTLISTVLLHVQLKKSSYGSFEDEWEKAPLEAELRNAELAAEGKEGRYTLLFEPELLETGAGKMILRGMNCETDGSADNEVYLDLYRNTIEYCFGFAATTEIPVEELVRLARFVAETVTVEDVIE